MLLGLRESSESINSSPQIPKVYNVIIQNQQYYSIINNLANTWNNPYRVSNKFYPYYHRKKESYEKNQPSDSEKQRLGRVEEENKRYEIIKITRELQHEKIKHRTISRQKLELAASQKLTLFEKRRMSSEVLTERDNIKMKQMETYKDPSKHTKLCSVL